MQATRCSALWQSNPVAARRFYQYVHLHTTVSATGISNMNDSYCSSFGGRRDGLMVSALHSRSSSLCLRPGRKHSVVFFSMTLNSHGTSPHPDVQTGTFKFNAGGNPAMD